MAAQGVRAGKAYIELGVNSKLAAGLKLASRRIDEFGARVRRAGAAVAGIGAAATGGLLLAAKSFASTGARVRDMSIRLGIGAETLSRIDYAAKQAGTSFEGVAKGIGRLARVTSDAGRGLETYQRTFRDLGIDLDQFQTLSLEEQFLTAGDALSKITDESKRAAIAQELFGRAGLELIPIFEDGAESVRAFFDEADRLGVTISDEEAKQAKALDDAFTRVTETLKRVSAAIGEALAPDLERLANTIADNIASIRAWLKENSGLIAVVAKVSVALVGLGAILAAVGVAFKAVAVTIAIATVAMKAFAVAKTILMAVASAGSVVSAVMAGLAAAKAGILALGAAILALNPITLAVAGSAAVLGVAIVALGPNTQKSLGAVGTAFQRAKTDATNAWSGITEAIQAGDIGLAADVAWRTVKIISTEAMYAIANIWNGVVDDLANAFIVLESAVLGVLGRILQAAGQVVPGLREMGDALREYADMENQRIAMVQSDAVARQVGQSRNLNSQRQEIARIQQEARDERERRRAERERKAREAEESALSAGQVQVEIPEIEIPEIEAVEIDIPSADEIAAQIPDIAAGGLQTAANLTGVTRGTFSGFAASRIGTANTYEDQSLKAQQETAQAVKSIDRKVGPTTIGI